MNLTYVKGHQRDVHIRILGHNSIKGSIDQVQKPWATLKKRATHFVTGIGHGEGKDNT